MPAGVKCTVSNCNFWDEGNLCGADSIQVEIDKHSSKISDTEFAILGEEHHDQAAHSSTTCCYTFKPRTNGSRK